jgi:hypothetical protein
VFHTDWDNAHQGKANSVAGFNETLNEFISYHFSNTDLIDQKNNWQRPRSLSNTRSKYCAAVYAI